MVPFYGYPDSAYPMLPNQYHHYHHRPGFEAVPPYMTGDVPRPGGGYGHWPFYGCNMMGYPGPGLGPCPCHSCLNHGSFPGYSVGPYPLPHQSHCCGYQSPVPGAGNAQCVVPPRYEYDKWVPGERHCWGCPNHAHRVKEEPEPDEGKKMESKSLVPNGQVKDSRYPITWTPNEQVKGLEPTRDVDQSRSESRVPNGWFPLDLKRLESLLKAGGVSGGEEHGNGEERRFPFPIVWFPPKNMETKADKEVSGQGKSNDESEQKLPCVPEFVPVKLPDQCEGSKESEKLQDRNDGKANLGLEMKKQNSPRIIEVKQISTPTECNSDADQNILGKSSEASLKKQQLSSAGKSSKLPPVCLRVEPLSKKKKNGNGASRSPSPPKSKSSSPRSQLEANMERDPQGRNDTTSDMKEAEEAQKSEAEVRETSTASQSQVPVELALKTREVSVPNGEDGETSIAKAGGSSCATESTKPEEAMQEIKATWGDGEAQKKIITDEEAALRIQSVYRGYNDRRWEPLKKLKQIAQVREQLTDVRSRIDALDSSDLQKPDKQAVVIGEMIMSLLLKLDTVQGLHPIVRDVRKSVARELVALQERLDTIKVENEISRAKHANSPMLVSGEVGGVNEQEPVEQDGNNGMLEARDADNRDLSFPVDDVHESKLSPEISGEQRYVGLQDSDHENNYALEMKHEEKSDLEAIDMEATADVCSEERDPPHGMEMEEDSSPENSAPTRAFSPMTSSKGIPEEHLHQGSLPGLTCAVEDKMVENPEHQDCKIVNGNGVSTDAALSHKEGNIFNVDQEDPAYEMNKGVSDDGSENLVGGESRYVNESLEFSESKGAPSFDVKKQEGKETKDSCSIDEEGGKVEGETENPSENSESATSEEAEQQTECLEDVNGRPYSEALQTEENLLACPQLPESKSFDELCGGEGSYDQDVEVDPAPEQKNIDAIDEEDELLTNADGSVADERVEEVKASEETQVIDEDVVIAPDAADTNDDEEAGHPSSEPSSDATQPFIDDKRLAEENAKLRETMEKLIEAGREQLMVISNLTGRVKDLEQKLSRKKRKQTRRWRTAKSPRSRSRAPMFEELER